MATDDFEHDVFLYDADEGTYTNLRRQNYETVVRESGTGRFYLEFVEGVVTYELPLIQEAIELSIYDKQLRIDNPQLEEGTVFIYNSLGVELVRFPLLGTAFQVEQLAFQKLLIY